MKILIKDEIGSRCIVKEDGQKIFDEIQETLKNGETVILDFSGVNQFASPFFNFSIGQLLKEVSEEKLRKFLKVENLNETGTQVIERVIENASKYHGDRDYREVVDKILKQQAEESE